MGWKVPNEVLFGKKMSKRRGSYHIVTRVHATNAKPGIAAGFRLPADFKDTIAPSGNDSPCALWIVKAAANRSGSATRIYFLILSFTNDTLGTGTQVRGKLLPSKAGPV